MTDKAQKSPVPMKSAEELRKLARGIAMNEVFTDRHITTHDQNMLPTIFMPILLGGLSGLDVETVGLIYEWNHAAGPRAINGYPMFLSCAFLHKDQTQAVLDHANKIRSVIKEATET